jgi:exodeoxyribonuclease-5
MVSGRMADDLMSFGVPILVLGDPGQLPPVGSPGFFTKGEPDFMLTEVHRQAKESGVLRLATMVREGQIPDWCDFGDAEVIRKSTLDPISVPHYDQILVGRNKTRTATNIRMRELLGRTSDLPQAKDRLVCLRNNHDMGLLNGEIYQAVTDADSLCSDTLTMHVESDDGDVFPVEAWKAPFRGEALEKWDHSNDVQEFDYGYTLTVHKAQGSQWPSVILFDQSATFRKDAVKWLYTGITRASERVTVVR